MQVNFWCLSVIIENDTKPPRQERKIKVSIDHPETLFRWQTTVTFMGDSLATHALNIHKHTSSLVSTWPIETYISVVNQHQATYETQSYLTQFTNSSIKYQHTNINQQIKRNTGSKKHIGLTHLLPLFCRSLSQFHLHAANRVWLWRNTSLSARLD